MRDPIGNPLPIPDFLLIDQNGCVWNAIFAKILYDFTRILTALEAGDPQAAEQLLPASMPNCARLHIASSQKKSRAKRSMPPRSPMKITVGYSDFLRAINGKIAPISSPPPRRPCAVSSSNSHAANER
jgi:hypothetical protein